MKKVYGKLISVVMTGVLGASWYFDLYSLQSFVGVIYWLLVIITAFMLITVTYYISKFDNGDMQSEEAVKLFKPFGTRTLFDFIFNATLTSAGTVLLILIDSPVIAALYLISSLCALKLSSSCASRYEKALDAD